jgi:ribosomal protein S18 acetylase RimI-like enzyme
MLDMGWHNQQCMNHSTTPVRRPPLNVDIRPLQQRDLPLMEQYRPSPDPLVHPMFLADQQAGRSLCLVAWVDARPVGEIVVRWGGPQHPELLEGGGDLFPHPYIEAFGVDPDFQSRTIGTQILAAAEREVARRGYRVAGLAVAIGNVRARALYERLGYRNAGLGQFSNPWAYVGRDGEPHVEDEACVYLVKVVDALARP